MYSSTPSSTSCSMFTYTLGPSIDLLFCLQHTQDRWRFLVRRWFRYYNAKGSNKKFIEIYELDRDKSCLNRPNEVDLSRGFLVYADMFPGSMIGEQKPCKSKVFLWDCVPEKLREKLLHFNQVPIHWEHLGHTCSIGNVKPPPKYHRQAVKLPS